MSAAKQPRARGIFEAPSTAALDLPIVANANTSNHPGLNLYYLRDDLLVEQEKDRICKENGTSPLRRAGPSASSRATRGNGTYISRCGSKCRGQVVERGGPAKDR